MEGVREAVALPEVPDPPSAAEYAKHCLTHLPYRRWCRWCVVARMANSRMPTFSRSMPLFVMEYCFIKHAGQDKWLTVLVGKLYPSGAIFAFPCFAKGPDQHVTARFASLFRACGVV